MFEAELSPEFHALVGEIMDAVEERFELLSAEGFRWDRSDWRLLWQFEPEQEF